MKSQAPKKSLTGTLRCDAAPCPLASRYIKYMKSSLLSIFFVFLLLGCSSSDSGSGAGNNVLEGVWFSDCVNVNLLPFPMYYVAFGEFVIMELNFENGDFYSVSRFYNNDQCQNIDLEYNSFEGTYEIIGEVDPQSGNSVKRLDMELKDNFVFYDLPPFTTYYVIEDGILYMNDTLSSEVNINRNVAFTK
ncbi:hypothetical protein [Kaarinaea lacus]